MIVKKALLLAAGFGTRLRPLTNTIPKCLVPINGKPLLEIWLNNLSNAGTSSFLVNTHYLSNHVKLYIENYKYANQVQIFYEEDLLVTAGTLLANLYFFKEEDGLLIHADNYCMPDISAFYKAHFNRPTGCLLTMMTFKSKNPSQCGIVEIDKNGIVIDFHEKVQNPPGNLANGAVYILSSKFIEILKKDYAHVKDFSTEILNNFIGKIYTYKTEEIFMDIGTPEMYNLANTITK